MLKFIKTTAPELALFSGALTLLTVQPAWAFFAVPGPASGLLAGGAIIGALVIAKALRRK